MSQALQDRPAAAPAASLDAQVRKLQDRVDAEGKSGEKQAATFQPCFAGAAASALISPNKVSQLVAPF